MKRILSFILVLVIMLSMLPFAVFADDGIDPCAAATPCSECGSTNTSLVAKTTQGSNYQTSGCPLGQPPMVHTHRDHTTVTTFTCYNCGNTYPKTKVHTYCLSNSVFIN